jgi:hypothetical protein
MTAAEPGHLVNGRDEGRRRDRPHVGYDPQPSDAGVSLGEGFNPLVGVRELLIDVAQHRKSGAISESKRPGSGKLGTRWLKVSAAPVRTRQPCWRRSERITEM